MVNMTLTNHVSTRQRKWLKRAGMAGFWFFLIKGLLWLAAPLVFFYAL